MKSYRTLMRGLALAGAAAFSLALAACNSSSTPSVGPTPTPAQVRAVHGSPDAGPVDIYVYKSSKTRPTSPTVGAAAYPQITSYLSIPPGTYTVDVIAPAGSPSTTTPVASESVTVSSSTQYSIVVGGKLANNSLQFINFVESAETAGTTALLVHHASPFVQGALNAPVAVGVYNAAQPVPTLLPTLFTFSLTSPISGPATSGNVAGGEYFLSPLPNGLPTAIGFAAGPSIGSGNFSVLINATPSQLASGLKNPTTQQQALAADTSSAIPAGAHLSIFAVDTASAAQLIGTLDP